MSMYKFVKGSRLFMQGKRENTDYDNVADSFHPTFTASVKSEANGSLRDLELSDGDELRAVHTLRSMTVDGNTEWERSAKTVRKGLIIQWTESLFI